jgi:hypothetical protein
MRKTFFAAMAGDAMSARAAAQTATYFSFNISTPRD